MSDANKPNSDTPHQVRVTRSPDYRTIYSDFFRTRVSAGNCTIVFSKVGHEPNVTAEANVIGEQTEIVMSWTDLKIFAMHISSLAAAIESEAGPIPVPAVVMLSRVSQFEQQRSLIRGQQLVASHAFTLESIFENVGQNQQAAESVPVEPPQPARRGRRKAQF